MQGIYNKRILKGYKVMGYWSRRSVAFLVQDPAKTSGFKQARCVIVSNYELLVILFDGMQHSEIR